MYVYTYDKGYPVKGDTVWFTVNFPAESQNTYVRQSVRLQGGSWTSRNVYAEECRQAATVNLWYYAKKMEPEESEVFLESRQTMGM